MEIKGKHKCYFCDREFNWSVAIKDDAIDSFTTEMNEERGIATLTGKNRLEIDVNCPTCRNVNRFRRSLK